jgi:hypothetical protein
MKINWCKIIGHKWIPVYIKGEIGGKKIKFIGVKCGRCGKGYDDLLDVVNKLDSCEYNTYNEKYYGNKI